MTKIRLTFKTSMLVDSLSLPQKLKTITLNIKSFLKLRAGERSLNETKFDFYRIAEAYREILKDFFPNLPKILGLHQLYPKNIVKRVTKRCGNDNHHTPYFKFVKLNPSHKLLSLIPSGNCEWALKRLAVFTIIDTVGIFLDLVRQF